MRNIFVWGLILVLSTAAHAQSTLFFPRNQQKAYDNGTRSHDGKPGPRYWQNKATYELSAEFNPKNRRLDGVATITYTNNSPDTLTMIRLKLAADRYRKNSVRAYDVAAADVSDQGVRIEAVEYNKQLLDAKSRSQENTFLDLHVKNRPLAPGAKATMRIKWSYTLPGDASAAREYARDSSVFFVPYWYPQVAVYDDVDGWASAPYNGLQEFYHEFADYDVTIGVPHGYHVWATGEWQNPAAVFQGPYLARWKKALTDDAVTPIFTEKELKKGGIYREVPIHRFRFTASNVPDFAFAASNCYNWDATSTVVDDKTGRRCSVNAVYDSKSPDYPEVARIAADGIRLMSTWLPGYPFPYPCMTVFNGNDGMEFPMMCNDASTAPNSPMTLTIHEVSHTYFPFMMGINEQDYAWMDEGWAAFFDYMLSDSLSQHKIGGVRPYSAIAGTENDVPPMVRARNLTTAYRNASYQRPQNAYFTLLDLLGYETFHRCMTTYMDRWKGKHPRPFDFFNTFNEVSGQNLDWFWKPWFFDWGYPDLAIGEVKTNNAANCDAIRVLKKGNIPVPIHVEVEYEDGTTGILHETPAIWKDGQNTHTLNAATGKKVVKVLLGKKTIPDVDDANQSWRR